MSTTRVGRIWNNGKCIIKREMYLNSLKYTQRDIEDYDNFNINKQERDRIFKEIKNECKNEKWYMPQIIMLKESDLLKVRYDTEQDILKNRKDIEVLNLQIPLARNKEVLEELKYELHERKVYVGDELDNDFDGTLDSDLKVYQDLIGIMNFVAEQEELNVEDLILTIETC